MFSNYTYYSSLTADWSQLAAMTEFWSSEALCPFPYTSHTGHVCSFLPHRKKSFPGIKTNKIQQIQIHRETFHSPFLNTMVKLS